MNTRKQAIIRGDTVVIAKCEAQYHDKFLKIIDKCSEDPDWYKKNKSHEKVRDVFTSYAMYGKDRELVRDFIALYGEIKKDLTDLKKEIETTLQIKKYNNNNDLEYIGSGIARIKQTSEQEKIILLSRKFYNMKADKDIYPDRYLINDIQDASLYARAMNTYDMIPESFTF